MNFRFAVTCETYVNGTSIERCYKFYHQNMNYFDAQDLCKDNGGHVMEITSAAEDAIITELLLGG